LSRLAGQHVLHIFGFRLSNLQTILVAEPFTGNQFFHYGGATIQDVELQREIKPANH